jgi:phosphoserine phosphatase
MNINGVIFDCDGTLTQIEGIDHLAKYNGIEKKISELTEQAMSFDGITPELYQQRLDLVRPNRTQCLRLAQDYFTHRSPGIDQVITTLKKHNIAIFIISAGVNPSVKTFASLLDIPEPHVFAVDLTFDQQGEYQNFDHSAPMTQRRGKRHVVAEIKKLCPTVAYIGDGQNDMDVYHDVDCFIGYGGSFYRPNMEASCEHYLRERSLLGILPILGQ